MTDKPYAEEQTKVWAVVRKALPLPEPMPMPVAMLLAGPRPTTWDPSTFDVVELLAAPQGEGAYERGFAAGWAARIEEES